MPESQSHKYLYYLVGLAVLVNFSGLFVPLMDPDAGVYASISKTMVERHDFVNLYFQETDWLDKPHFPFWITAVFFKIFGFKVWAYKLPGILFVMMGAWYTYRLACDFYNRTVALWSVFILLTATHIIISNNDVRAEPFLTGLVIGAIWHFSRSLSSGFNRHLLIACLLAACAVMTKGIFTLIPIGGAVAGELIIKNQWKQVFHPRWIIAGLLVALFITPELYCLWKQFDTHPEKTVLGNDHVSGIRFFLWDSQFGRFFNTGPIKGKGDKLFFLHTLLWAFLPWSLILYGAAITYLRNGIKKGMERVGEWYTVSGSLLTLLVFSFSGFQLPHYSNIVFPLMAIPCAAFVVRQVEAGGKLFSVIQTVIGILLIAGVVGLLVLYRPVISPFFLLTAIGLAAILILFPVWWKNVKGYVPYIRSGIAMLFVGVCLNLAFYPDLLNYQSGNLVAARMNRDFSGAPLARIGIYYPAGEFYLHAPAYRAPVEEIASGMFNKSEFLFITEEEKKQLEERRVSFDIIESYAEFHVTMLSLKFLNPHTREKELKTHYLVRLRS